MPFFFKKKQTIMEKAVEVKDRATESKSVSATGVGVGLVPILLLLLRPEILERFPNWLLALIFIIALFLTTLGNSLWRKDD